MWICPTCGRSFVHREQSHTCRQYELAGLFSGERQRWLPLYQALLAQTTERLGDFSVYVSSSEAMWRHQSTFAALRCNKSALIVEFFADRLCPERNPKYTMRTSAHRMAHFVEVTDAAQFADLLDWLAESYFLTLQGRRR